MKIIRSIFKIFFYAIFIPFALLCIIAIFKIDSSLTKINPKVTQELVSKGYTLKPPTILISYADGSSLFFQNQNALVQSAADKGFDFLYQYKRSNIDKEFWQQNQRILEEKRGAGSWLWKPYFIMQTMYKSPENSTIIYADGAIVFTKDIENLISLLKKYDIVFSEDSRKLSEQLKKEAYNSFGIELSKKILDSKVPQADFIMIKNTEKNRLFIQKWLKFCMKEEIITHQPLNIEDQAHDFSWHSADQAILGVLVAISEDNLLILQREKLQNEYGVKNFHRHKHREFSSPLFLIAGLPDFFSKAIWNSKLLMFIRGLIFEGWHSSLQ